jgi:hypothetical protein
MAAAAVVLRALPVWRRDAQQRSHSKQRMIGPVGRADTCTIVEKA